MEKPLTKNIRADREPPGLKEYERAGGYRSVRRSLRSLSPQEVTELVKNSNLRGRGGAGFPTGSKWSFVPMGADAPRPKYLSAYAIQADVAYIFLRWEYRLAEKLLKKAIAEAYSGGYLGKNILGSPYSLEMRLHVSAGRYMCGEETGLLNALEGKRATPRSKPPYPQVSGLWGKPTIVNNVETLCNVHHIVNNGAEWFKGLSRTDEGGTKIYGVSGKVKRPGAWELPMGVTVREILEEHAGGMRDGLKFRGAIPGGASTDFLVEEHLDVKMDFASVQKAGSRMGTGTMIILDDQTCPVGLTHNLEQFFARESCGWCTPCREGLPWTERILRAIEEGRGEPGDLKRLSFHTEFLGPGFTFCALAPGAMEPLQSALKYFREDFERHVHEKRCPYR